MASPNAHDAATIAELLAAPFPVTEVQFKPGVVSGNRALALAYVDARSVQDRLDAVLGIDGWQDDYQCLADGAVVCKLRLRIGGEWITKTDVGGQSEQPDGGDRTKAAFSDALKRAAVKYGVGRYLYNLPAQWVDFDPKKKQIVHAPPLPAWAIPKAPARHEELLALLQNKGKTVEGLLKWLRVPAGTELKDLTPAQVDAALKKLRDPQSSAA
jgi:hypothetical protein